jgi:hypothetical protein
MQQNRSAIGTDVVVTRHGDNVTFRNYLVERTAHTASLRSVEAVLEISIVVAHPARRVWPVLKNSNLWMKRFGYEWDGIPGDNENNYISLGNTGSANDLKYGTGGHRTVYVVRKVIPEQLIYQDSLPIRMLDKDCVWSGHNLTSLREDSGRSTINVFMEHTWFSESLSLEALRNEARGAMFGSAVGFWRDYFIPDLLSLIDASEV